MCDTFNGKDLWVDPIDTEAKKGAVLLSDQIAFYAEKLKMISPFDPQSIRPASYLLHVGSEYYIDETPYHLSSGEAIKIPENGLAYIRTLEWFNIPYYLIARYNLEVRQLYRGFLLDNGLQIDPGYHGHIYCPIHNLTNQEKKLKHGNPFVVVDFIRTSPFKPTNEIELNLITKESDLLEKDILGVDSKPIVLFAKGRKNLIFQNRRVHDYWFEHEKHSSSMHLLQKNFERLKEKEFPQYQKDINEKNQKIASKVANLTKFSVIGIIAIIIALFSIIMVHFYWQEGKFSDVNSKYEHVKDELTKDLLSYVKQESRSQLDSTKNEMGIIDRKLEDLRNRQDISHESIEEIQDKLLEFENLFMEIKTAENENSKSVESNP